MNVGILQYAPTIEVIVKQANIKCPECGHKQKIKILHESCLPFYVCEGCKKVISAPKNICCVICAYSDKKCPVAK